MLSCNSLFKKPTCILLNSLWYSALGTKYWNNILDWFWPWKLGSVHQCQTESQKQSFGWRRKESFIALPGEEGHSSLLPSTMCPNLGRGFDKGICNSGSKVELLIRWDWLQGLHFLNLIWTITEGWALKNWCFWTAVLEKTLESPLDCKKIQPVHPEGNQSWICIGRMMLMLKL